MFAFLKCFMSQVGNLPTTVSESTASNTELSVCAPPENSDKFPENNFKTFVTKCLNNFRINVSPPSPGLYNDAKFKAMKVSRKPP